MSNVINKKSIIAKTTGVPYVVGRDGDSAYEVAVKNGYTGTEQEWLASLKGATGENGDDGFSPTVSVSDITGGHRLTITDAEGTRTVDVLNGSDSVSIRVSGGYIQYSSNQGSTWSNIIAVSELKGEKGDDGEDGVSPSISVASITGGHRITISFKGGLNVFNVMDGEDGEDGQDGQNGTNGQDGHSPVVTASKSGAVTTVSVDGTPIASINDGQDGEDGSNGITPTIGENENWYLGDIDTGKPSRGAAGQNGTNGSDGTTFTPSVSSAGVISWTNDGGKTNPNPVNIVSAVISALPTWQGGSY